MKYNDIEFLVKNISVIEMLPVRIFKEKECIFFYYSMGIIKDPIELLLDKVLGIDNNIGYFSSEDFFYYAYVKSEDYKIIFGPFRLLSPDDITINKLSLNLGLSKDEIPGFTAVIKSIKNQTFESFFPHLSNLNLILNNEKLTFKDLQVDDEKADELNQDFNKQVNENNIDEVNASYLNNTYLVEKELYSIVENGEIDRLRMWLKNSPQIKAGILSNDNLRQLKNTFVAAITLISRAAIKGHMDEKDSLSLSDLYIQKMELLTSSSDIYMLLMNMVIDYTERVSKIKNMDNTSSFMIKLNKYILNHLSDPIKSKDVADYLFISKSTLFYKIKSETNMTFSNYILSIKINESKNLLRYTDRSISSISIYLGFSSQSHFNHALKKFTSITPVKYRNSFI